MTVDRIRQKATVGAPAIFSAMKPESLLSYVGEQRERDVIKPAMNFALVFGLHFRLNPICEPLLPQRGRSTQGRAFILNRLQDTSIPTTFQESTLSTDAVGRFACSTWDEAINNGGLPFDIVVIGAGMFGGYCAEKLYRFSDAINLRVLVLDAGSFLVTTHLQNLPKIDLNPAPLKRVTRNQDDPGPQSAVWGYPWHGNEDFPGLAYCIGGKSVFWGGWSPTLTPDDLAQWPADVVTYLNANYQEIQDELAVTNSTKYLRLNPVLKSAFATAGASFGLIVDEAPLAVQGTPPEGALFSFDKYRCASQLIDAAREDVQRRWTFNDDSRRRLILVPRAQVTRLVRSGSAVREIQLSWNGQPKSLFAGKELASNFRVVLALSTIESTRLALTSFPAEGMGSNLMAHLRSNTTVRIKRSVFTGLPAPVSDLETGALIVRGAANVGDGKKRQYHLQVTAAATSGSNPEKNMFAQIPDFDQLGQIKAGQSKDWIVIILRGIGEIGPDQVFTLPDGPKDPSKNWVNLAKSPDSFEQRTGTARAWVNLVWDTAANRTVWRAMDDAAIQLAQNLAGVKPDPTDPTKLINIDNIQFLWDGKWQSVPPPPSTDPYGSDNKVRDKIGSTHHESGTLWMGAAGSSVTDIGGRFHHVDNAYVAGPALFPQMGSANPSLTATALARRTADAIVKQFTIAPSAAFKPLFTGSLAGWQMAGRGGFNVFGNVMESFGGIGLLWYTREEFENFLLKVEWRASSQTDNSGVFLRFPSVNSSDPANDWLLPVNRGYEVQIDDTGFNPDTNTLNDPLHQTGAIYTFAPSSHIASKPVGEWNLYEIEATSTRIKVTLNGQAVTDYATDGSRPPRGHIGLQNHHDGSRVQFRTIEIRSL